WVRRPQRGDFVGRCILNRRGNYLPALSGLLGLIGSSKVRRNQVIREPECSRRIHRIGLIVRTVIPVPRLRAPAAAVINRSGPRIVSPSVVCGTIVKGGRVTVVGTASIIVIAIPIGVVVSAPVVGSLGILPAAVAIVGALAVSAVSSVAHHRAPVVHALNMPAAMCSVIDRHPTLGVDRAHLAILAESRAPAALQGDRLASCWLM